MKFLIEFLNRIKLFPYYVVTPIPYALGTAAIDILYGVNKAKMKNKKLIFIAPSVGQKFLNYNICNEALFNGLLVDNFDQNKTFIKKIFSFFINISFFFNRCIALFLFKFLNIRLSEYYFFSFIGILQSYEEENKIKEKNINDINKIEFFFKKNPVSFNSTNNEQSLKLLREIGCQDKQDFVCLHVRESVFRNDGLRRPYRNSDIKNYYEMINFLLSKNIFVIRMGRKSEKPIEIKNKYLFDLPFSKKKYDYFDLFLIKNCKFYIGDQSGPTDAAVFFSKDCLKTNMLRLFELPPTTKKSRSICKLPFFKKNNKKLNLREYLDLPYIYHHPEFLDNELDFSENSSEDLYNAIEEYWHLIYKENRTSDALNKTQQDFNKDLLGKFEKMYFEKDNDLNKFYRKKLLFRWLKSTQGSYCTSFLKKYYN